VTQPKERQDAILLLALAGQNRYDADLQLARASEAFESVKQNESLWLCGHHQQRLFYCIRLYRLQQLFLGGSVTLAQMRKPRIHPGRLYRSNLPCNHRSLSLVLISWASPPLVVG
jgi:hypothetical protein